MPDLAEHLAGLELEAHSTDGRLVARVSGDGPAVHFAFSLHAYRRYSDGDLAAQLGQLTSEAWRRHRRASSQLIDDLLGGFGDSDRDSEEHLRYLEQVGGLVAERRSAHGHMAAQIRGLDQWAFLIADGCVQHYQEQDFLQELRTAIDAVMVSHRGMTVELRNSIWGDVFPANMYPRAVPDGA